MRRLECGHPLGIYPLGNALLDKAPLRRLGELQRLGDELLLQLLRGFDLASLGRLSVCSRCCRGFAGAEELWQLLVQGLLSVAGSQEVALLRKWQGSSWREAYLAHQQCPVAQVSCRVYSDCLYRGFFYAATVPRPAWLEEETLVRVPANELSVEDFLERFEGRSTPVILEGAVRQWKAMAWCEKLLKESFSDVKFACGAVDLTLEMFYDYAKSNMDDVPLFIFDKYFAERAPKLLEDYEVPDFFRGRDLFDLLENRPDFRWLLIGNRRSGSKWHLDPNKTCAWNAVVRGKKRWLLLPPGCPPPGVHPTKDGAEVTQPVSLLEWFSNFYDELKEHVAANPAWDLKEGTCGPGDLVFIPSGWWHCVLNLEDDTIAITQNYCSETHVSSVRRFLSERREQVSGFSGRYDLAERFDAALAKHRPDLLATEVSVKGFSFWEHLRSTGKSLSFESEPKKRRLEEKLGALGARSIS